MSEQGEVRANRRDFLFLQPQRAITLAVVCRFLSVRPGGSTESCSRAAAVSKKKQQRRNGSRNVKKRKRKYRRHTTSKPQRPCTKHTVNSFLAHLKNASCVKISSNAENESPPPSTVSFRKARGNEMSSCLQRPTL